MPGRGSRVFGEKTPLTREPGMPNIPSAPTLGIGAAHAARANPPWDVDRACPARLRRVVDRCRAPDGADAQVGTMEVGMVRGGTGFRVL